MDTMQTDPGKIITSAKDGRIKRISMLIAGILVLWLLISQVGPWIDRRPSVKPLIDFIEENNIDASALYYTEIEEFAEADIQMNHTMDFAPRGP